MESTNAVVKKRNWKNLFGIGAMTAAATAIATSSFATETVSDLMTGADISGAKTATYTMLLAFVGIGVLFKGRTILAKLGVSV